TVVTMDWIRMPRRSRDAVTIMMDRKDARVVLEAFLDQNIERPQRMRRDRVARRAIASHGPARHRFERALGPADVFPECAWRQVVHEPVPVAVRRDFVTERRHTPDQRRMALGDPPKNEERRL